MNIPTQRRLAVLALTAAFAIGVTGCGSADEPGKPAAKATGGTAPIATAVHGAWLLGFTTAEGADGETTTPTYVRFDPDTGAASVTKLPQVKGPNVTDAEAALLVSADHKWAIPDTGVSKAETDSGKVTVHSLDGAAPLALDLRALTKDPAFKPLGWAFDPVKATTLRVVGDKGTVWVLDVAARTATKAGDLGLEEGGGWVFADGFNPNTGEPYVESITSETTKPEGNGPSNTEPVKREQGTLLRADSAVVRAFPADKCRLVGAFETHDSGTWAFCADAPSLTAWHKDKSGDWKPYGKPSPAVGPDASGLPVVLPPVK